MAILFLFFTVGIGARSLLVERAQGTLTRVLAAPVGRRTVLAGGAAATFVIGVASVSVVLLASTALLGASWGHPAVVIALVIALTFMATALTYLISTVSRTEEQANGYTSLVALGLALIGGSFFPLSNAPPALRRLSQLTPNGHAMQEFTDLAVGAHRTGAFLLHLLVIMGFAIVLLVVAALALVPAGAGVGPTLTFASVGFRQVVRDKRAVAMILVLPLVVAIVVGMADRGRGELRVGVSGPPGRSTAGLAAAIDAQRGVVVERFSTEPALRRAILRGGLDAGAVVRSGAPVVVLLGADTGALAARVSIDAAVANRGRSPESSVRAGTLRRESVSGHRLPSGLAYSAPAMLVLFTFITSLTGAVALIEARRIGVVRRVLASPARPAAVLTGMGLGRLGFALTQSLIIVVGTLAFGVAWGDPIGVGAVILAFALVSTAAALLVAALAPSPHTATALGAPIAAALGMLGGCMWPLETVGHTMTMIGHVTPQAWAMDAWLKLADGRPLADLGPSLLALLAFTAVFGPFAVWRLRRSVTAG